MYEVLSKNLADEILDDYAVSKSSQPSLPAFISINENSMAKLT